MGKYAIWLKERYGLQYLLREHNFECLIYERFASVQRDPLKKAVASIHGKRLRKEETKFIREAAHVAPITEQDLALMREVAPDQEYTVIPAGVDVDYFRPSNEPIDPTLALWVGGMSWDPNKEAMEYFLDEVWPQVLKMQPSARFEIVGEGTDRLAIAESIRSSVKGHGRVPDIRPYLARAAVMVVPLRIGGGMRLKILDFFAAGKAVVSTSIGAEGNTATHGEHLILADSSEEMAQSIARVMNDPSERERLGRNGRMLVEREYAWGKIGQDFMSLYAQMSEAEIAPISGAGEL
jgi:glycosyltransferase involved in cell wall biosynthesis